MKTIHGTHSDRTVFTLCVEDELFTVIQDGVVTEVGITFEVDLAEPTPQQHRTTMTKAEYEAFMDELRRTGLVWQSSQDTY
jgi:hypothetical protein